MVSALGGSKTPDGFCFGKRVLRTLFLFATHRNIKNAKHLLGVLVSHRLVVLKHLLGVLQTASPPTGRVIVPPYQWSTIFELIFLFLLDTRLLLEVGPMV
jgi:hypothetical protein